MQAGSWRRKADLTSLWGDINAKGGEPKYFDPEKPVRYTKKNRQSSKKLQQKR